MIHQWQAAIMLNKNSILLGIILGVLIPFIGYALLLEIYDQLDAHGFISDVGMSENFRNRTIALLAICLNLIPFLIYNRMWYIKSMRGIIFPTVIYAFAWVMVYGLKLV